MKNLSENASGTDTLVVCPRGEDQKRPLGSEGGPQRIQRLHKKPNQGRREENIEIGMCYSVKGQEQVPITMKVRTFFNTCE